MLGQFRAVFGQFWCKLGDFRVNSAKLRKTSTQLGLNSANFGLHSPKAKSHSARRERPEILKADPATEHHQIYSMTRWKDMPSGEYAITHVFEAPSFA